MMRTDVAAPHPLRRSPAAPDIFGPHDNWNLQDSHVIPGLIHKLHLAKKNNEDFVVWGSGKPLRQFVRPSVASLCQCVEMCFVQRLFVYAHVL